MAIHFVSRRQPIEQIDARKEAFELLKKNRRIRHDIIKVETGKEVLSAIRASKSVQAGKRRMAPVDYWKPNSVMRLMEYKKLGDDSVRDEEIRLDITYFEELIVTLRNQFREYNIEIRHADKARTIPNQLEIWRK